MGDQRRSFSIVKGRGATARQTTGRTQELGIPRNGLANPAVPGAGIRGPSRPLRESDDRVLSSVGRDAVGYNSDEPGDTR